MGSESSKIRWGLATRKYQKYPLLLSRFLQVVTSEWRPRLNHCATPHPHCFRRLSHAFQQSAFRICGTRVNPLAESILHKLRSFTKSSSFFHSLLIFGTSVRTTTWSLLRHVKTRFSWNLVQGVFSCYTAFIIITSTTCQANICALGCSVNQIIVLS